MIDASKYQVLFTSPARWNSELIASKESWLDQGLIQVSFLRWEAGVSWVERWLDWVSLKFLVSIALLNRLRAHILSVKECWFRDIEDCEKDAVNSLSLSLKLWSDESHNSAAWKPTNGETFIIKIWSSNILSLEARFCFCQSCCRRTFVTWEKRKKIYRCVFFFILGCPACADSVGLQAENKFGNRSPVMKTL